MGVRIVVDSASDTDGAYMDTASIDIVPLTITFNGKSYLDGIDITKHNYYNQLKTMRDIPKTSQPTPESFFNVFENALNQGNEVLYIGLSSGLSGTIGSAAIARDMVNKPEKIHIVDSLKNSAGIGLLAAFAQQLLAKGESLANVINKVEEKIEKSHLYFVPETLENLRKGGRISHLTSLLTGILNIKPIFSMTEGKLFTLDKFRGKQKALMSVVNRIEKIKLLPSLPIVIGHVSALEEALKLKEVIEERIKHKVVVIETTPLVGTHIGIGAIGVCCLEA